MRSIRGTLGGAPKSSFFSFQDIIMAVTGILIIIALMLALQIDRVTERIDPDHVSNDSDPLDGDHAGLASLELNLANLKEKLETLQAAARKTESLSEIQMEIERLEERIVANTPRQVSEKITGNHPIKSDEMRAKAAEIIRLREEIRECEKAIAESSDSAGDVSRRMKELEEKVKAMEAEVAAARIKNKSIRLIRELSDTTKEPVIVDVGRKSMRILRFDKPQVISAASLNEFYTQIRKFRKEDQYFVLYFRPSGASWFEELTQAVKNSGFEVGYDAIDEDAELALGKADDK
jgi:DNA repair exonuclease SbcCD ATPase subunit